MSVENAIMDSHEPLMQFTHALNRVLEGYGMELQSMDLFYTESEYLPILQLELEHLLADPMDPAAEKAIRFVMDNMHAVARIGSARSVGSYLDRLNGFLADRKSDSLLGISGNVYYVDFGIKRRRPSLATV